MQQKPLTPKIVLGVAAHPDDLEFCMGGSAAAWVQAGTQVHYLICTDGSKGTDDPKVSAKDLTKTRQQEQRQAAEVLGVNSVDFLDYQDGLLQNTLALKRDVSRAIRRIKPDVVVTWDPTQVYSVRRGIINHTDHRAVGLATIDAVYPLARDRLTFPELLAEGYEPHKVATLLLVNLDEANYYVDISATFDTKIKALYAHQSQVPGLGDAKAFLREAAQEYGKQIGCQLAEGFIRLDLPN